MQDEPTTIPDSDQEQLMDVTDSQNDDAKQNGNNKAITQQTVRILSSSKNNKR